MFFGLLAPSFWLYSVYVLWFTCSQILAMFCLYSLVYFLPDFGYFMFMLYGLFAPRFSYDLFMLFGLLAPRCWLYSFYALWFTCSQILGIFCLCSFVYLLPDFSYILFMLFDLLAPRFCKQKNINRI
jgi:hypothetical protein